MGCRGPWGWREQQGLSGREPLTDALSGSVAGVICGFSAEKEPRSSATLRPLQGWNKAAESAGGPMAPLLDCGLCSPGAHVGYSGGGGWLAWRRPVCWDSSAKSPLPQGPPPWSLSAEWGWGTRSPQPLQGPAENVSHKGQDTGRPVQEQGPSVGVG